MTAARGRAVDLGIAAAALVAAYALKRFYSTATAEELAWILAPTVGLLERVTGAAFEMEAGEGYLSRELNLLVAPACAGVNFLMAALCTGVWGLPMLVRSTPAKLTVAVGAVLGAYTLTLVANTTRLFVAVSLPTGIGGGTGLGAGALHRVEGTVVYFGLLCVSFLAAHTVLRGRSEHAARA